MNGKPDVALRQPGDELLGAPASIGLHHRRAWPPGPDRRGRGSRQLPPGAVATEPPNNLRVIGMKFASAFPGRSTRIDNDRGLMILFRSGRDGQIRWFT